MNKKIIASIALTSCIISQSALAVDKLEVGSTSFAYGGKIPEKFAYCAPDGKGKTQNAQNISPEIHWSGAPKETKSFAIVVVDPDVPAKFDDANKEGKTIAKDLPRQNFYHWVQIGIPANVNSLEEANDTVNSLPSKYRGFALVNDYASFMKDKPKENFASYDGPCPPWNDERVHSYHFMVYALPTEKLDIKAGQTGKDLSMILEQKAIAKGEIVGTFSNFAPSK